MRLIRLGHRGSAILVALIIVILITVMAMTFLEKIIRLSKTTGGIENSAQAYTLATGLIEEQLIDPNMTKKQPWNILNKTEGTSNFGSTGRTLIAYTGADTIPMKTYTDPVRSLGTSSFNPDWNIISLGQPVQIVIPEDIDWSKVEITFRVPDGLGGTSQTGAAPENTNSGIILWTFGYSGASLYASGETNTFIGSRIDGSPRNLLNFNGFTNMGENSTFPDFYTNTIGPSGAKCINYNCTLKFSMIRPFKTNGGQVFPLLEYSIKFPPGKTVPNQYMVIDSSAYVRGYLRSREVRIPQITTNTAIDFTVLQ